MLGGGFAGGYVARLLGSAGATIVSPENFMLYTPLLPEAASGTLEPRHVVVPLRLMCPQAELLLGKATALDEEGRTVHVVTEDGGGGRRLRAARRRARLHRARTPGPRTQRARARLQEPRRRHLPAQSRPPRAGGRRRAPRAIGASPHLRLHRRRLRRRRSPRRSSPTSSGTPCATTRPCASGPGAGCSSTRRRRSSRRSRGGSGSTRRASWPAAASTSASRRRSTPWTPTAASSPTEPGSRATPSSGRPA